MFKGVVHEDILKIGPTRKSTLLMTDKIGQDLGEAFQILGLDVER